MPTKKQTSKTPAKKTGPGKPGEITIALRITDPDEFKQIVAELKSAIETNEAAINKRIDETFYEIARLRQRMYVAELHLDRIDSGIGELREKLEKAIEESK